MHLAAVLPVLFLLTASLTNASPFAAKPVLSPRSLPCNIPYTRVNSTNAVTFEKVSRVYEYGLTMTRYKFRVDDQSLIDSRGIAILNRLRCHDGGGIYNNWQFYKEDFVYAWFMEFNEVNLSEGRNAVNSAIYDVTGQVNAVTD